MSHTHEEKIEALGRVIDTLDILRVKCPWDAKQTNESLRPNTIEEVYELCDALINEDNANIRKERCNPLYKPRPILSLHIL